MLTLGPSIANIMLVGDFPSQYEKLRQIPFAGPSGEELSRMLRDAGLMFTSCFSTLASPQSNGSSDPYGWVIPRKSSPNPSWTWLNGYWISPEVQAGIEALKTRILLVKPKVVVALGNLPLLALTGRWGIKSWRGSVLQAQLGDFKFKVIPTWHPSSVLKDWSIRPTVVQDFRRVLRESTEGTVIIPNKRRIIRPNFATVVTWLQTLLNRLATEEVRISSDTETRAGHIACLGYALSSEEAICIPMMCVERPEGYWDPLQEQVIWDLVRKVHKHPNARIFGQNYLYDSQYFYRWFFLDTPIWYDTMVAQHCIFPGTQKSLDYLASLYCDYYVFWKDEGKEWNGRGEDALWAYNCDDCMYTYEIAEKQLPIIQEDHRLQEIWNFQQNILVPRLFAAMVRGVRTSTKDKALLARELKAEIASREDWITKAVGHHLNIKSSAQMKKFFYDDCNFKPILNRKTMSPTLDDKALEQLAVKEPAMRPFIRRIQELRSLHVFLSTFVEAKLDIDGRMRSSFNPTGTETFRLSSSTNAFWSGINFQNIPKGSDKDDHTALQLPNIRKLYLPDPGYVIFDMDLDRADLQVVVWEADDEELRQALLEGVDLHSLNAKVLFNLSCSVAEVKKLHGDKRQLAKSWCHGTNYGGGPRTMAKTCGITIHEAEKLRRRWFGAHPGIETWHKRQSQLLQTKRIAENKFGYRITFFDRLEAALPQALAWVPQSTVAVVINKAWNQIMEQIPEVEILIQVHDSLVGQCPISEWDRVQPLILEAAKVTIPYERPLVIPAGIASSTLSWGDCK